jgi:hypothetical protein
MRRAPRGRFIAAFVLLLAHSGHVVADCDRFSHALGQVGKSDGFPIFAGNCTAKMPAGEPARYNRTRAAGEGHGKINRDVLRQGDTTEFGYGPGCHGRGDGAGCHGRGDGAGCRALGGGLAPRFTSAQIPAIDATAGCWSVFRKVMPYASHLGRSACHKLC